MRPTAAALALLAVGAVMPAAAQDCATRLENLRASIDSAERSNLLWRSGLDEEVTALWRTARSLLDQGDEEACQQVSGIATSLMADLTLTGEEGALPGWAEERVTSYEETVPVEEHDGCLSTDRILDANLRNMEDEFLGEIVDVVFGDGGIRYVLVDTESFLGIGSRQVAVPWRALRVTQDEPVFVLDIDAERLEQAPSVEAGGWQAVDGDFGWMQENDAWYAEALAD